jgi:hypothetical protein
MSAWQQQIQARFAGREDIGAEGLYNFYFRTQGYPKDEVLKCLALIESEVGIHPGILRPSDKLNLLFQPIETKNPFKWMVYQVRGGDMQAAISSELTERLHAHGTFDEWDWIDTVEDLVRAWCGLKPKRTP